MVPTTPGGYRCFGELGIGNTLPTPAGRWEMIFGQSLVKVCRLMGGVLDSRHREGKKRFRVWFIALQTRR